LARDAELQGRQRKFSGYVGQGKKLLAPATQALVEAIKETMEAYGE